MVAGVSGPSAAAAYRGAAAAGAGPADGGFGSALKRALEGVVETGRRAEEAGGGAMLGQVSVTDAVLAVNRAELALQTAVALRDKAVSAYQDVMRMPI